MSRFTTLVCFAALVGAASAYSGIGDQVAHTFLKFDQLPLTASAAKSAGWSPYGGCDPYTGQGYRKGSVTDYHPIEIMFTGGGQIAGVTVYVSGDQPIPLVPDYWVPASSTEHRVTVSFRGGYDLCKDISNTDPVGDRLVINQDGIAFNIPLTNQAALEAGFFRGGCISGMGTHWGYDIYQHPAMVFNGSTALNIVPMYDGDSGAVSAFLVMTPQTQEYIPAVGDWEGPFIASLLCYNYCSSACPDGMGATSHAWNTMHFLLHNHKLNTCAQHCA